MAGWHAHTVVAGPRHTHPVSGNLPYRGAGTSDYLLAGRGPWPETSRQAADPFAVLTAAAVATETVRIGTAVLIAALHTPVQLAKALATIDQYG